MNLLLYAESRFTLARQLGEPVPAGLARLWAADPLPALPDSLFAELGYCGALEEPRPDAAHETAADEDNLDDLFLNLAEPLAGFR